MPVKIEHYREMGEFEYGAVVQMTPMIRRVICKTRPRLSKGTGTYIVGTGRVAVIDPGPPCRHTWMMSWPRSVRTRLCPIFSSPTPTVTTRLSPLASKH